MSAVAIDNLSIETVRDRLDYEPATGNLRWRDFPGRRKVMVGDVAGIVHKFGYRKICINYRHYMAHRLAWAHYHGEWPPNFIDHINGIRDDNRIANLRLATSAENLRYRVKRPNTSSVYKGVSLHKASGKWRANISINVGLFDTEKQAALAYNEVVRKYYGEFARLNLVEE